MKRDAGVAAVEVRDDGTTIINGGVAAAAVAELDAVDDDAAELEKPQRKKRAVARRKSTRPLEVVTDADRRKVEKDVAQPVNGSLETPQSLFLIRRRG
jgi:DNA-binding helix-hairpin-helix protein with protein kinase domain